MVATVEACVLGNCTMQDGLGKYSVQILPRGPPLRGGPTPHVSIPGGGPTRPVVGIMFGHRHAQHRRKADDPPADISRTTAASCNLPHESRVEDIVVLMSVLFGVATLAVILRTLSKLLTRTFCTEDHMIIAGLLIAIVPLTAIICCEFHWTSTNIVGDSHDEGMTD